MHDSEVHVSEENQSEHGEGLVRELPSWMLKHESSGNFKLLDVVGRAFDETKDDLDDVDDGISIQTANTVDQLQEIAQIVGIEPKTGEPAEKYRARVIAEFQKITNEGTLPQILSNLATILKTDTENILYNDLDENGAIQIEVPLKKVEQTEMTEGEVAKVVQDQIAAGYRIFITLRGTFEYLSESDATANNHNSDYGYTTVDESGNRIDNGGTYSGFLN